MGKNVRIFAVSGSVFGALCCLNTAIAGGLERTPQSVQVLFEDGNYIEGSMFTANPTISGTDVTGVASGNVSNRFTGASLKIKSSFSDSLSGALIIDQPFGVDVGYGPSSPVLGGTTGVVDTTAVTGLLSHRVREGFRVHGGARLLISNGGSATLSGDAFSIISGYQLSVDDGATGVAPVAGVSYEIPKIALRFSATYSSKIDLKTDIVESFPGVISSLLGFDSMASKISFNVPRSLNLYFQTGVAEDTLFFGSVRRVAWTDFVIDPPRLAILSDQPLVSFPKDTTTYTLGIGRRINDSWSLGVRTEYEGKNNTGGSPLAPNNGYRSIALGGRYSASDFSIGFGVSRRWLGNAIPQVNDIEVANFSGSKAYAAEARIGFKY